MKPTLKKYLRYGSVIISGGILLFILIQTVRAKNTGFETKTLWDWMELLIITLVLAAGALYLERSEREAERKRAKEQAELERTRADLQSEVERQIADDRQQEAAPQAYLDRMAESLLKDKLRTSKNEEVQNVARIRTLTVLRGLDATRKGIVLLFLYASGLIRKDAIIDLSDADLRDVDLRGVGYYLDLSGVRFGRADLENAYLGGARLGGSDLQDAYLKNANLEDADLTGANLSTAILIRADLSHAKLNGADLSHADLDGANLSGADLRNVYTFGATFRGAVLTNIHLLGFEFKGAELSKSDLRGVDLKGADLSSADLSFANLEGADLSGADLYLANLTGAKISDEQLASVKSLGDATMPDGTIQD